jgi:virginiamycin A acetyltransferase
VRRLAISVLHALTGARRQLFHARLRTRGVDLGEMCKIAVGSKVSGRTKFGRGTVVVGPSVFKGREPIHIGRYCAIGDGVRMISSNHRTDVANMQYRLQRRLGFRESEDSAGPIRIGNNVWIGDAAIILDGVAVGDGAVIAAGAIVTGDIPAFAIAAGVPACVIRKRFSEEEIKRQTELAWWEWPEEKMRQHEALFSERLS